jgi:hypothetical protein
LKAVSVSAELLAIQRAVQHVADSLDVENVDGPVSHDAQRQVVATLNLVTVRLRDLGRAARGRLPVELFWAPHNEALDTKEADEEDLILYELPPVAGKGRK